MRRVIEHLQEDAVHGGIFFRGERGVAAGEFHDGEDRQQAVAEVVDGGVGEDALQIFLRQRGVGGKNDGRDREPQQRRQHHLHFRAEDGQQNAQEAVEAHLRHGAGQKDGGAGGRFCVGGGQPGMEGNERDFDREAEERSGKENQRHVVRCEAAASRVSRSTAGISWPCCARAASWMKSNFLVARKMARKDSSMATLPTMV